MIRAVVAAFVDLLIDVAPDPVLRPPLFRPTGALGSDNTQ